MKAFKRNQNRNENGNVFLMLFAGVAMVGLLGAAAMNFMQGPLKTATSITRNNAAQTQMLAASKLVAASALTSPTGDCDSDGLREPPEWKVATGAAGTFPAGGGHLPDTLGASKTDPWGTPYGYCGWDHGTKINDAACGGSVQKRLGGGTSASGIVISMISAGPDKIFQTTCAADPNYVTKPTTSDDVVMNYTVAEMGTLAGGTGGGGTTTTPADCTGMGEAFYNDATTGHCYYRSTGMKNWDNAQADCQASGGYLAVISSSAEQAILKNNFTPVNGYIGARSDGSYPLAWRWKGGALSGVEFWRGGSTPSGGTSVDGRYNNWSPGGPTYNSGYDCVMMSNNSNMNWTISQCNPQNPYYCEKEGVTLATGGSDNLGDHAATQTLNMNGYTITGAGVPILLTDVANKAYVDSAVANAGGGGGSAAPFSFPTMSNMASNNSATQYLSDIVQVTGITGEATAVFTMDNNAATSWRPKFRICADEACNTVISPFGEANKRVQNNNYLQILAYRGGGSPQNVSITIGSTTGTWLLGTKQTILVNGVADTVNVPPGGQAQSAISKVDLLLASGNVQFSSSINDGSATPQMRLCSDNACAAVLQDWFSGTSTAVAMTNSTPVYYQLRATTPLTANAQLSFTVVASVNGQSDFKYWTVKTGKTPGFFIGTLVNINSTGFGGNDGGQYTGGGRAMADAACYGALSRFSWYGKAMAEGDSLVTAANIKAFICDQTACNNPVGNSTYIMGYANSGGTGSASFSTNASGQGPNDALSWTSTTAFSAQNSGNRDYSISNRSVGAGNLWGTTPAVTTAAGTCNNFTNNSGTVKVGYSGATNSQRWNVNDFSCNAIGWITLICMVHPAP